MTTEAVCTIEVEKIEVSSKGWKSLDDESREDFQAKVLEVTKQCKGDLPGIITVIKEASSAVGHEAAREMT